MNDRDNERIDKLRSHLKRRRSEILEEVSQMFKDEQMVTWEQLDKIEVGEEFKLGDGVTSELMVKDETTQTFFVKFENGGEIGSHHHDCSEWISSHRGRLMDLANNEVLQDSHHIRPFQIHNIKALSKTCALVEFER